MARKIRIKCCCCQEVKSRGKFEPSATLQYGVTPWCLECYQKIAKESSASKRKSLRRVYMKDYQKSYHAVYLDRQGIERRKTKRGAARFTQEVINQALSSRLTVAVLRRPEVHREFLQLLPAIKGTNTFKDFCDWVAVTFEVDADIKWVLAPEYYPEFMFATSNVRAVMDKHLGGLNVSDIPESLTQLGNAVKELYIAEMDVEDTDA